MDGSVKIPAGKPLVMDLGETFNFEEWKPSRLWAEQMMRDIPHLRENFDLDQITLGDGQCFYTATLQQLRRPDVMEKLSPRMQQLTKAFCPRAFKRLIRSFIINNTHPTVFRIKEDFELFMGKTWEEYWCVKHMMKKETWAEEPSIRATAWLLKMDIVIHQNIPESPEKLISGNIDDENVPMNGPKLHLGYILPTHYQSLLPKSNNSQGNQDQAEEFNKAGMVERSEIPKQQDVAPLKVCPVCGKTLKNVLLHIRKTQFCESRVSDSQMKVLTDLSNKRTAEKKKENNQKKRIADPVKAREDTRKRVQKHRMNTNPEKLKEDNKRWKETQKHKNPDKMKEGNKERKKLQRKVDDEMKRLKNFLKETLFGPIFICLSCQQRHFKTNIQVFNENVKKIVKSKIPLENCIDDWKILERVRFGEVVTRKSEEDSEKEESDEEESNSNCQYICKTCLGYLRKGKLPPTSVMNHLKLRRTDKELADEGLILTELENSLIQISDHDSIISLRYSLYC